MLVMLMVFQVLPMGLDPGTLRIRLPTDLRGRVPQFSVTSHPHPHSIHRARRDMCSTIEARGILRKVPNM